MPTAQHHLTAHPSTGRRIPGIEGLRAIAATSIVIYHVWGSAAPDWEPIGLDGRLGVVMSNLALGVTLFFCLSGFLLYGPFAASLLRADRLPDWRAYGRNRALRILPAFWVCAVIAMLLLGLAVQRDGSFARPSLRETAQLFTFTMDWFPSTIGTTFPVTWSLAVEAVFYVVLPLLAAAAATLAASRWLRSRPRAAALLAPAALLALGLGTRFVLIVGTDGYDWSAWFGPLETGFLGQCDLFAYGMLVAVLRVEIADGRMTLPRHWRRVAGPAALAVLAVAFWKLPIDEQLTITPWNSAIAVAMSVLLAAVVLPPARPRPWTLRVLEFPPLVALGVISYSVFLWHQPVIDGLREHGLTADGARGFVLNLAVVFAVTVAVSALSYRFVEAPALARKRSMRRVSRRPPAPPGTPPAAPPPGPPASSASCPPSASRGACASG